MKEQIEDICRKVNDSIRNFRVDPINSLEYLIPIVIFLIGIINGVVTQYAFAHNGGYGAQVDAIKTYGVCKCEMARIENARKQRADGSMGNKIGYKRYVWRKLSEAQLKKEELEAYMIAAENAVEIVKLMEENQDFQQLASAMEKRFGFTWSQTRYLRYMPLYIFDKKVLEEKKQELDRVMDTIEYYKREYKESEE